MPFSGVYGTAYVRRARALLVHIRTLPKLRKSFLKAPVEQNGLIREFHVELRTICGKVYFRPSCPSLFISLSPTSYESNQKPQIVTEDLHESTVDAICDHLLGIPNPHLSYCYSTQSSQINSTRYHPPTLYILNLAGSLMLVIECPKVSTPLPTPISLRSFFLTWNFILILLRVP